jgi:hypothetical protein
MLAPTDRRLLLSLLAPDVDYELDQAIGTTYTLDLLALLRVPLAATALPWASGNGGPVSNPFALLAALRQNAAKISLYCHAGATSVPARHTPLIAFLEDVVHPVVPPRKGGVFHPKLWLLRFRPLYESDEIRYRLLVMSRNMTFDRSWDIALALDGRLLPRQRGLSHNRPLSDFIASLPSMATAAGTRLSQAALDRVVLIANEVRRVDWSRPDGFDTCTFHPIGHTGRPYCPVQDVHRLLVLSPFVETAVLSQLRDLVTQDLSLVGRFEELAELDPDLLESLDEVDVFDDAATLLEDDGGDGQGDSPSDTPNAELSGLHAKAFVGKRGHRAVVYVGSANATAAAFEHNVEFVVELEGSTAWHGIDRIRESLRNAGLLRPFVPGAPIPRDEPGEALQRRLERAATDLAGGGLRARTHAAGEAQWRLTLHNDGVALDPGIALEARPLSYPIFRRVDLATDPACSFAPTGLTSLSPFFALRLTGRMDSGERQLEVTVLLPLEGAPHGRLEAVTADMLSDRERLLRFLLLLLADEFDTDRILDDLGELTESSAPGRDGGGTAGSFGLPLLEPMLRTLHRDPERLDEVDRLLADLRAAGGSTTDVLPDELIELWETVQAVREEEG